MNDERWRRLRALFAQAAEMSEAARKAFLDRELAGDPDLRGELEALLAADATASGFLASGQGDQKAPGDSSLAPGSTIGPYQLIELLGEGGFGIVYLAEQLRPIQRRVAIKLIKPGMDTKQAIARFEAERQALALMDHPGIAQVFDAGETETGRLYIVMEHVPGIPITKFCDRERLRIPERLDLFLKVCDAVQHAHQKGVIHRDLKPSNVLVARRDGVPVPKVIDFGIVKATNAPLDDRSFETREGMVLGTLGYISPEQVAATGAEVDTRSDIYSLGIVLYELLVGEPPFDKARLRKAAWAEAVRVIREEDPPGLTTRVGGMQQITETTSTTRASEIAHLRSVDERSLLHQLKGELEWITLRALEKEPNRRYSSASEFSADIRRHLANEAVLAGPPSATYRMRKFARRHRTGVAAAALVLLSIVAGGIATGIGFSRAVRAERIARREAGAASRVSSFLVDIFRTATPDRSRGETITARTLLDQGALRLKHDQGQDPHVRARLLSTLGSAQLNLGLYDEGVELLRLGLASSESARPPDPMEVADQIQALTQGLRMVGEHAEIDSLLDRALELARNAGGAQSNIAAGCLAEKAALRNELGQLGPADSLISLAIAMGEAQAEPDTVRLIRMYSTKANIAHRRFDLEDAERDYVHALALADSSKSEPGWSVGLHRKLASLYGQLRQTEKAMSHAQEGVRIAREIYPPNHANLADALSGLAAAMTSKLDFEGAVTVREEALGILRAGGAPPIEVAPELNSLGILYRYLGKHDLAIARTEESFELWRQIDGLERGRTPEMLANLALCYSDAGQKAKADSLYRVAIPLLEALDPKGGYTTYAAVCYANVVRDLGRLAQADTLYAHAEAMMDTSRAGDRPLYIDCLVDHAYSASLQGRHAEAESLMRVSFGMAEQDSVADSGERILGYVYWAVARARAGDAKGAVEVLEKALPSGITAEDVAAYPEIAALRSLPGYPVKLR